jgi:hypothetical protein
VLLHNRWIPVYTERCIWQSLYESEMHSFSFTREHKLCLWTTQLSKNIWDLSRVEYTQHWEPRIWSFVFKSSGLECEALRQGVGWRLMRVKRISMKRSWATTNLGDQGVSETGRYVRRMGDQCCYWMKMCPVVVPDTDHLKLLVPVSQSTLSLDSCVTLTETNSSSSSMYSKELYFNCRKQSATYRQLLCRVSVVSD